MTPQEFKMELSEYIVTAGFYPVISPWQKDMIDKMMVDYAMVTGQIVSANTQPAVLTTHSYSVPVSKDCATKKKEEIPMSSYASANIIADTTERDQRDYARNRIRSIRNEKLSELEKQFGLVDDKAPSTPAEFVKRIADGQYTINKEKMDKETYNPASYIRWRSPDLVEDTAGYRAAADKLNTAYTKAKDKMVLGQVSELEAAIDTFAGWTLS